MSLFASKTQLAAVTAQAAKAQKTLDGLKQLFARADVRLDQYPAEIAAIFGDALTENMAGRWTARGVVGDVYSLDVSNVPDDEKVTFTASTHGNVVPPLVISLHPGAPEDFTALDFERMEAWIQSARTGVLPDPNRHAVRASKMAGLLG